MHFYEKNIVEIKNEYTKFLINIIRPFIYEGILAMYLQAIKLEKSYIEKEKVNPQVKNPGTLKLFQSILRDVPDLNNNFIDEETKRIKERGKCSDFFDDLVRAVIKSYIVLMTYNASGKKCKVVNERLHENINIRLFIHKCYIECAKIFFNYPELFWHKYSSSMEAKKNQRDAYNLIAEGITEAIRKMLPVRLILEEYLSKDYIEDSEKSNNKPNDKYASIKNMVRRDLYSKGMNAFESNTNSPSIFENPSENKKSDKTTNKLVISSSNKNNNKNNNSIVETSISESINQVKNNIEDLNYDNLVLGKNSAPEESISNKNNKLDNKPETKSEQKPKTISGPVSKEVPNTPIKSESNKDNKDNIENKDNPAKLSENNSATKEKTKVVIGDKKMVDQIKKFINKDKNNQ
jgi:hypothetical protein